jgi:hypothetical protein
MDNGLDISYFESLNFLLGGLIMKEFIIIRHLLYRMFWWMIRWSMKRVRHTEHREKIRSTYFICTRLFVSFRALSITNSRTNAQNCSLDVNNSTLNIHTCFDPQGTIIRESSLNYIGCFQHNEYRYRAYLYNYCKKEISTFSYLIDSNSAMYKSG